MTSSDDELEKISAELKHFSLRRQHLLERKKFQCLFQELKNRVEFGQAEEADSNQCEIDSIDDKLKQLTEKKAELQKRHDDILTAKDTNIEEDSFSSCQKPLPDAPFPASNIICVEAPPSVPAPSVILDLENLPPCPCRTQCPECRQFIVTETFTSVSSLTWLVCFMTALIGCAAGCCLIPFCMDTFKSTTHKCPKCRTSILTVKKL